MVKDIIKIMLADDHVLVREGLKRVLDESGDMSVVALAKNGSEAVKEYGRTKPDVAIIDISMPIMDGLDTSKLLKDLYPDIKILILTMHAEEQYAVRLLKAGVLGYLTKGNSKKELYKAVRTVAEGKRYLPEESRELVLHQLLKLDNKKGFIDYRLFCHFLRMMFL